MIVFEILTRRRVFEGINPGLILELLRSSCDAQPNLKLVEEIEATLNGRDLKIFVGLKEIMIKCWITDPRLRPSAPQGWKYNINIFKG